MNPRRGHWNLQSIANWSKAQVTTWTGDWQLKWGGGGGSVAGRSECLTYRMWCYLWVDSVRIELNFKILIWSPKIAWWYGKPPLPNTHIYTLELVPEPIPERINKSKYLRELKTYVYTKTCTWRFIVALFIVAKKGKWPKCLSTSKWIHKMWYGCSMEYHLAIKNEVWIHGITWLTLKTLR